MKKMKPKKISFFHPASLIGTCLGVGKIPFISGTFGSIFAVILLFSLALQPRVWGFDADLLLPTLFVLTIALYFIGVWASEKYIKATGEDDPKAIVIDEVAGMFTASLLIATIYSLLLHINKDAFLPLLRLTVPYFAIAVFILFRLFDICKPWIIGKVDRNLGGGHGVMLDDVLAGVFTAIAFFVIFFVLYFSGGFIEIFRMIDPEWVGTPPPQRVY